jgi:hypothetical protein
MKDKFPPTGGGVNIFRNALKSDVPVVKMGHGLNQMLQRPSEPIESPDNEVIPFPDILQPRFKG